MLSPSSPPFAFADKNSIAQKSFPANTIREKSFWFSETFNKKMWITLMFSGIWTRHIKCSRLLQICTWAKIIQCHKTTQTTVIISSTYLRWRACVARVPQFFSDKARCTQMFISLYLITERFAEVRRTSKTLHTCLWWDASLIVLGLMLVML